MDDLTWSVFKAAITARGIGLHWAEDTDQYHLSAHDGPVTLQCRIHKTAADDAANLADFEANYKTGGNQPAIPRDADGAPQQRTKVTSPGWHFGPRCMSLTTAKRASLHNRKHDGNWIGDGTDYADATLKFFDTSGAELVQGGGESDGDYQARLTANCGRTELMWTPTMDRDAVGGMLKLANVPAGPAYAWFIAAPHIPTAYGGSVPFVGGGVPLHVLGTELIDFDGRGVKRMAVDGVYYSHRFGLIIKHQVGEQITMGIVFEDFIA